MGWVRKHPIAAVILGAILALFALIAAVADDPGATAVGLAVIYAMIVGVYALAAWIYGAITGKRRPFSEPVPTPPPVVIFSSPPPAPSPSVDPVAPPTTSPPPVYGPPPPIQPPHTAPSLGDLLMLTPAQFEDLTLRLLVALGYKDAQRVGGSGDLAADVTCRDPQGRSTIVQCKRYAPGSNIGAPVIQTFIGMKNVHHRADRGIVVTTATFSQPAVDLARQHGIALVDGAAVSLLVHLTGVPLVTTMPREHIYCRQCGAQNPIGDRFCAVCGSPLGSLQTTPPVA